MYLTYRQFANFVLFCLTLPNTKFYVKITLRQLLLFEYFIKSNRYIN